MQSIKQRGNLCYFVSHWYDLTWDWTQVSRGIGEHSDHYANGPGDETNLVLFDHMNSWYVRRKSNEVHKTKFIWMILMPTVTDLRCSPIMFVSKVCFYDSRTAASLLYVPEIDCDWNVVSRSESSQKFTNSSYRGRHVRRCTSTVRFNEISLTPFCLPSWRW